MSTRLTSFRSFSQGTYGRTYNSCSVGNGSHQGGGSSSRIANYNKRYPRVGASANSQCCPSQTSLNLNSGAISIDFLAINYTMDDSNKTPYFNQSTTNNITTFSLDLTQPGFQYAVGQWIIVGNTQILSLGTCSSTGGLQQIYQPVSVLPGGAVSLSGTIINNTNWPNTNTNISLSNYFPNGICFINGSQESCSVSVTYGQPWPTTTVSVGGLQGSAINVGS
jgi:hypothetical protein